MTGGREMCDGLGRQNVQMLVTNVIGLGRQNVQMLVPSVTGLGRQNVQMLVTNVIGMGRQKVQMLVQCHRYVFTQQVKIRTIRNCQILSPLCPNNSRKRRKLQ